MSESIKTPGHKDKPAVFQQRLDFYWQFIAVYSVILLFYSLMRGSIEEGKITLVLNDPLVLLLAFFIITTSLAMLVTLYRRRKIIIGKDYIIFKNRFRQKKYSADEIIRISLGRVNRLKKRAAYRVIRIKVRKRRRAIRIRPNAYWDDKELIHSIMKIKKLIRH